MWKIKHIFDGDYGCEEVNGLRKVSVTIINEKNEERTENVPEMWLTKNALDEGSIWPDYSDFSINTEGLILKKAKQEDWEDMYNNLWRYEESARYMLWDVTTSEAEAIERARKSVAFQKVTKYAFFIYEKETNVAIGFAGMKEIEPGVYEDTGIAIGPSYTQKGYGTQVLNTLVEEAKRCGAHKFVASCRKQNIASHDMQMKCGFQFVKEETRIDPRTDESYILEFNEKQLD